MKKKNNVGLIIKDPFVCMCVCVDETDVES